MTDAICTNCSHQVTTTDDDRGDYWCEHCNAVLTRDDVRFPNDEV